MRKQLKWKPIAIIKNRFQQPKKLPDSFMVIKKKYCGLPAVRGVCYNNFVI